MRILSFGLSTLLAVSCVFNIASASCTAPEKPGVRICSPSPNSTVSFIPAIDFNSTPASGASITNFIIYVNGQKTVEGVTGQTGDTVINTDTRNGLQKVTIHAWDTAGNLYSSSVSFTVVGEGYPSSCAIPSSPGVNFCEPPAGTILGPSYSVAASAKGDSKISAMRLYVDGKAQFTQGEATQLNTTATVGTQGDHKLAFVAWDTEGHVFSKTRTIHSTYTYSYVTCPFSGPCGPGFDTVVTPATDSYVGNSFTIQNQIQNNPRPITTLKAYLDGKVVATSSGPTMISQVNNAPSGTHIITLQAWDTAGTVYRVQYNVNINVAH